MHEKYKHKTFTCAYSQQTQGAPHKTDYGSYEFVLYLSIC